MHPLQLSDRPKPGQIRFFVDLSEVQNMTVAEVLALTESLGFTPVLRYQQWENEQGKQLRLVALLTEETWDTSREFDHSLYEDELETLAERIQPNTAIHFQRGLLRQLVEAAA